VIRVIATEHQALEAIIDDPSRYLCKFVSSSPSESDTLEYEGKRHTEINHINTISKTMTMRSCLLSFSVP